MPGDAAEQETVKAQNTLLKGTRNSLVDTIYIAYINNCQYRFANIHLFAFI